MLRNCIFGKLRPMRTHKKFIPYFYAFFVSLLPVIIFIFFVSPDKTVNLGINIGAPLFFFFLVFVSLFLLFTFIFANRRRGILGAVFFDGILVLRSFGLTSLYQIIILLIIVLLIEYLYTRRSVPPPSNKSTLV